MGGVGEFLGVGLGESLRTNNVGHIKWVGEFLGVGLGEGLRTNNVVHIKYRPCISHCAIL